jgi:hypothetical protein
VFLLDVNWDEQFRARKDIYVLCLVCSLVLSVVNLAPKVRGGEAYFLLPGGSVLLSVMYLFLLLPVRMICNRMLRHAPGSGAPVTVPPGDDSVVRARSFTIVL